MIRSILDWLDQHFVEEWRDAWRWLSIQLNAVPAFFLALFSPDYIMIPLGLAGVTASDTLRIALMIGAALGWFIFSSGVRLWDQTSKEADDVEA